MLKELLDRIQISTIEIFIAFKFNFVFITT
jgi:hypothetical protein